MCGHGRSGAEKSAESCTTFLRSNCRRKKITTDRLQFEAFVSTQQLSVCAQKLHSKQNTTQTKNPIHSFMMEMTMMMMIVYDDGIGWTHPVGGAPAGNCRLGSRSLESWFTHHHMALHCSALHFTSVHWWAKKKQALDVVKLMRWSVTFITLYLKPGTLWPQYLTR